MISTPRADFVKMRPFVPSPLSKGIPGIGEKVSIGRFSFLNHEVDLGFPPDWDPPESLLWKYHLHYFDWLRDLYVLGEKGRSCARLLVTDWIENAGCFDEKFWHPYPLSVRIVNWFKWSEWIGEELILRSLHKQIRHLASNLEFDVGGNHLIKNLKALIFSGFFFEGKQFKGFKHKGEKLLERELKGQVLPDGGHFERAPSYHLQVLEDLLDLAVLFKSNNVLAPKFLQQTIERMVNYLPVVLHPDGEIALFSDSAIGNAPPSQDVISKATNFFHM